MQLEETLLGQDKELGRFVGALQGPVPLVHFDLCQAQGIRLVEEPVHNLWAEIMLVIPLPLRLYHTI